MLRMRHAEFVNGEDTASVRRAPYGIDHANPAELLPFFLKHGAQDEALAPVQQEAARGVP